MIEIIHENKSEDEEFFKEMKVLPCLEDLFCKQIADYKPFELPRVYKCNFIDKEKAKLASFNNARFSALSEFTGGFLYEVNDQDTLALKTYLHLADILEESKNYGSRFRKIILSREKTTRLNDLCRANGAKMSTVFHLIVTLAIKALFKKHGEKEKNIIFNISISLRQFAADLVDESLKDDSLVYCVGALSSYIDADFESVAGGQEFASRFWEVSKFENDRFHSQIKNENQKFFRLCHSLEENEFNFHFIVTNVGRLKPSLTGESDSLFKVTKNFTCDFLGSAETFTDRLVVNLISSLDDQVNWVVSFNAQFLEESMVDELVASYLEIIDQIL
jgi:hypothetical protein